jgi:hypothetical protein
VVAAGQATPLTDMVPGTGVVVVAAIARLTPPTMTNATTRAPAASTVAKRDLTDPAGDHPDNKRLDP